MDNSAIDGNDGSLLTVLTNGQVNVANVQFVDATARAYTFAGTLTGLDRLNAELQGADIYTVGGTRVNKVQKGINVVRQADGSVKKVLVK